VRVVIRPAKSYTGKQAAWAVWTYGQKRATVARTTMANAAAHARKIIMDAGGVGEIIQLRADDTIERAIRLDLREKA
jgi:hypothetical protein